MHDLKLHVEHEEFLRGLEAATIDRGRLTLMMLETVGYDTISFLRSLTDTMRPPAREGEGERKAHPGGWADVTSVLAQSYRFEVHDATGRVRWTDRGDRLIVQGVIGNSPRPPFKLIFFNDAEYAAALEAKEAYYVLSGVTDPGGPVERALAVAADRLDLMVRTGGGAADEISGLLDRYNVDASDVSEVSDLLGGG